MQIKAYMHIAVVIMCTAAVDKSCAQQLTRVSSTVLCTIAGIAGVSNMDEPRSNSSSVQVSYPAYPTLQPITSEPPASSYAQYTAPPQQDYSHGHSHYEQGSQSPYQQQVPQFQAQQPQQQQSYKDLSGGQSAYGASLYGQEPVQVQRYQQVKPCTSSCHAHRSVSAYCCTLLVCPL